MTKEERIDAIRTRVSLYQHNPVLFAHEVCCFQPDEWQCTALMKLAEKPKVTVRSGQGVGKTGIEAIAAWWFLVCFPFSRVVATAPTRQQLNDVLWSEMAKWQAKSPLLTALCKWTKTYVTVKGYEKRWFAVARAAAKAENMQGFHEDNMLFIIDEASGVADEILEAVLGTLSGANNKLLMCGNPTQTTGIFYDSHNRDRALYETIKVSSLDSPRANRENIDAMIRKYGKNSNFVRVRILGEFPINEDDVFIPIELVERSIKTEPRKSKEFRVDIGCDVARFGDDKTVIGYKINESVFFYMKIRGQATMKTADKIVELGEKLVNKYKIKEFCVPIKVDGGGVGGGVVDRLNQIKLSNPQRFAWMNVVEVSFGAAIKNIYYDDSTTFMMSRVRDMLSAETADGKQKDIELILPDDEDLVAQLSSRKYAMTDRSKIRLESKKDFKKRAGVSPDEADCVLLLCLPTKLKRITGKEV